MISLWLLLIGIIVIILFIILFNMKEFNLLKLYLVIIAIIWLIWTVIGYGNLWYNFIKYKMITPEEYIIWSSNNYEIKQCDDSDIVYPKETSSTDTQVKKKTPEEIKICQDKAKSDLLARRDYDYKDNLISWIIWWTIFLILFLTHFPIFLRRYQEDKK